MILSKELTGVTIKGIDFPLDLVVNVYDLNLSTDGMTVDYEILLKGQRATRIMNGQLTMSTPPTLTASVSALFDKMLPSVIANIDA
jgi:hypothetical protein